MSKFVFIIIYVGTIAMFSTWYVHKTENANILTNDPYEITQHNFLTDYKPMLSNGDVNVVVEITAGTLEKWEVDKETGGFSLEMIDDKPRIINYLGYPGNYGMIPRTLLPKEKGGDGDPLDIIVLGPPVDRGSIIKCKLIGVLFLLNNNEQDDKLIAVIPASPLAAVNSIDELKENYTGILEIIEIWFSNYKGHGEMQSNGYGGKEDAIMILNTAIDEYKKKSNK